VALNPSQAVGITSDLHEPPEYTRAGEHQSQIQLPGAPSYGSRREVHQRASHTQLCLKVPRALPSLRRSRNHDLDAIIVPASRPVSFLRWTISLAARLNIPLVVLCSEQAKVEHVVQRVSETPGTRSLVIAISETWSHPHFPDLTSAPVFQEASAHRRSDLSVKRNLGLLLARLQAWNKVLFVDDDIRSLRAGHIVRLSGQLDTHEVAGMTVRKHADNSVVCHARRLAGLAQDVFVTGAVLAVHCNSLPLSYFPDIYNEDWFFFAREAAARTLPCVGRARQVRYDPFASPDRARQEEFGDLLAEGLYAVIDDADPDVPLDDQLRQATKTAYWTRFIEARRGLITETGAQLLGFLDKHGYNGRRSSALASLAAAASQLDGIAPDLCVDFLNAWRDDLDNWRRFSNGVSNVGSIRAAMDFLELKTWILAGFGGPVMDSDSVLSWH
jgi:hypothetical protein